MQIEWQDWSFAAHATPEERDRWARDLIGSNSTGVSWVRSGDGIVILSREPSGRVLVIDATVRRVADFDEPSPGECSDDCLGDCKDDGAGEPHKRDPTHCPGWKCAGGTYHHPED